MADRHVDFMKCGCTAAGTVNGQVACGLHMCFEILDPPDLSKRTARCAYGGAEVPSAVALAFFRYRPEREHDEYYCGCYGWD